MRLCLGAPYYSLKALPGNIGAHALFPLFVLHIKLPSPVHQAQLLVNFCNRYLCIRPVQLQRKIRRILPYGDINCRPICSKMLLSHIQDLRKERNRNLDKFIEMQGLKIPQLHDSIDFIAVFFEKAERVLSPLRRSPAILNPCSLRKFADVESLPAKAFRL